MVDEKTKKKRRKLGTEELLLLLIMGVVAAVISQAPHGEPTMITLVASAGGYEQQPLSPSGDNISVSVGFIAGDITIPGLVIT